MISVIIPTYRNPKCLDICLHSSLENQTNTNEIIVVIDGYVEESTHIVEKYKGRVKFLPLSENRGMQHALNIGVFNATNEWILVVNDDNVFPKDWDHILEQHNAIGDKFVHTPNQIERKPSIFNFVVANFGGPDDFDFKSFTEKEPTFRNDSIDMSGEIFPFYMKKKYYMAVGGFDEWYPSPFVCDWDFFLKLELIGMKFFRSHELNFYHFGSMATKNGKDSNAFKESESVAWEMFTYKWGFQPTRDALNSHKPQHSKNVKGINYE